MELDFQTGFELIQEAYKQKSETMLWQRWLVDYSRMDKDHFVGFEEYKKKLMMSAPTNKSKPTKTKQQIIADSEKIIAAWKGGNTK